MAVEKAPEHPESEALSTLQAVVQKALALSRDDREALLAALQDSLGDGLQCDDEYIAMLDREADIIDAGGPTYSLEEVVASLRAPR